MRMRKIRRRLDLKSGTHDQSPGMHGQNMLMECKLKRVNPRSQPVRRWRRHLAWAGQDMHHCQYMVNGLNGSTWSMRWQLVFFLCQLMASHGGRIPAGDDPRRLLAASSAAASRARRCRPSLLRASPRDDAACSLMTSCWAASLAEAELKRLFWSQEKEGWGSI